MMRFTGSLLVAVWLTVLLPGCSTALAPGKRMSAAPEVLRSSVRFQKEYLLSEGDQIEVSVWRTPEVSRTVVFRPDGNISLPLLQAIKAAGLSPRELAVQLQQALAVRLVKPEVNVIPLSVRQPTVYVLGDAKSPGAYPLRNAVTAAQALALAGGALRSAKQDHISIFQLTPEGILEAIPLFGPSSESGPSPYLQMAATPLKADDTIFIPESGLSAVVRPVNDVLAPFTIYLNYKLLEKAY